MFNEDLIRVFFSTNKALKDLNASEFYLLNIIFYAIKTVNDEEMKRLSGFGCSKYRATKKSLIEKGYLHIKQTGKAKYTYTVGGLYE